MVSKLDELCEQKTELQRQIYLLDSQIKEEKKLQKQRTYENLCKCYKKYRKNRFKITYLCNVSNN